MRRHLCLQRILGLCAIAALCLANPLPTASAATPNLLVNGSFERIAADFSPSETPEGWDREAWHPSDAKLTWNYQQSSAGDLSVKIDAPTPNDSRWIQMVPVQPNTNYLLSGYIKTRDVAHTSDPVDAGANLSVEGASMGTWHKSNGIFETKDWTYISLVFNTADDTQVKVAARLGYYSGTCTGTAWFDNLRLRKISASDPHPRWKILVLIYGQTDFTVTSDDGITHNYVGSMTSQQKSQAAASAKRFVNTDVPALNSQNMIPRLTVRYPERPLTQLSPYDTGWWPTPENTAPELDPAFDSVIVIWNPNVTDKTTGRSVWIGYGAGIAAPMCPGQTYSTLIIDAATSYGHLSVFKHEWGHSILFYYEAIGAAPKPNVTNEPATGTTYVHCTTGQTYTWEDETDANPIPNSIYNNETGFTHDYYSGTTAEAAQPTRCLGISPEAWAAGGPVSKPVRNLP